MYTDDDMLMLSGIQHYAFCARQWGLIHIEQAWQDNHLTIEGNWLHRHVDNPLCSGCNGDRVHLNAVPIISHELGLYGVADILELNRENSSDETIELNGHPGRWRVYPVEYKHGRPKKSDEDALQLCAQAMCLEEMHTIHIGSGIIYYGETRRRDVIPFDDMLRKKVTTYSLQMHKLMEQGSLPEGTYSSKCNACSLADLCMAHDDKGRENINDYLKQLEE